MAIASASSYRRPMFGQPDPLFRRCLMGAAALGTLFLAAVLAAPIRDLTARRVEQVPQRLAKLILEEPKPPSPSPRAARIEAPVVPEATTPEKPRAVPAPRPRRAESARPDPDAGRAGRERAEQAVTKIASATATLEKSLAGLSSSLDAAVPASTQPVRRRNRRSVGSGRSSAEVGTLASGISPGGGRADLDGSAIGGSRVAIGTLDADAGGAGADGGDQDGAPAGLAGGSGPGVYRTNASLLAVVQKYAAGIQFCYENELKHDERLSGKLVVTLTVAASGEVTAVGVVRNTLGSAALERCAVSQIRDWRFPVIDHGVTSFRVPFVFTPPK